MNESSIRDYILKYRDSFSKEQIISQLKKSGARDEEINKVYSSLGSRSNNGTNNKNRKMKSSLIGLILIIIGIFIPLFGFFLIIFGIVLGFKQKKVLDDGFSLFVIIFGFISLFIGFILQWLVIGALLLSFVNFSSLLPNRLDLNHDLIGNPTSSIASSSNGEVKVVFKFNGMKRELITPEDSIIKTDLKEKCYAVKLQNLGTNDIITVGTINTKTNKYTFTSAKNSTPFINSQEGIMTYDCLPNNDGIKRVGGTNYIGNHGIQGGLLDGDYLVGNISIQIIDPYSHSKVPSSGFIRLRIDK